MTSNLDKYKDDLDLLIKLGSKMEFDLECPQYHLSLSSIDF